MNLATIVTTSAVGRTKGRHNPSEYGAVLANALAVLSVGQMTKFHIEGLTGPQISNWIRNLHRHHPKYLAHMWERKFRTVSYKETTYVLRVE